MAPSSDVNGNSDNNSDGVENPAFVGDSIQTTLSPMVINDSETTSFLREFFDLTLALSLIEVVSKKREGNLRTLVFLVLLSNIVFLASLGESDFMYFYTRLKINWSGDEFVLHLTTGTIIALAGTLLMVGVCSKLFGISDAMVGIISTVFTLIAKPIYVSLSYLGFPNLHAKRRNFQAFATTTLMFYIGTSFDLFVSCKAIAIKSIISKTIPESELGRMFSVLAIIESIDFFVFPLIYSFVYLNTVEIFLGAIFILSEFFFLLTLAMFIAIYVLLRSNKAFEEDVEKKETYKRNPNLHEEVTKM